MKLYDLFFSTLEMTDDIDEAIRSVETEILKRKTSLNITDSYDELNNKLKEIINLKKKWYSFSSFSNPRWEVDFYISDSTDEDYEESTERVKMKESGHLKGKENKKI
ncbi:uncharacterized protein VNE69_04188 [Vairimorpha necatrix]|uniref:Uncharacterized protein n=1 Tax=Vairimorpha necatrix TaxID=6039 RepID=A0AAX4JBL8_9MICR